MEGMCDIGRPQPDLIALSRSRRRIAIIDISRPSGTYAETTAIRSQSKKTPPVTNLCYTYFRNIGKSSYSALGGGSTGTSQKDPLESGLGVPGNTN